MVVELNKHLIIHSKYYKQILSYLKLPNTSSRLVGGCVRDAIIGKPNSDIDIATSLLPEQVMQILSRYEINVVATGLKFGTVTAFLQTEKFEITTLRKDLACDGRHAEVAFTDSFMEDASRRDFTINALSYCPFEEKIYDYFKGIKDLEQKNVVFIGQAMDRIKEDYLRILRFFRFSCHYAKQLNPEGLKACTALKDNLTTLSKERIKAEMDKLLQSDNSPNILHTMFSREILQLLYPIQQLDSNLLKKAINFMNSDLLLLSDATTTLQLSLAGRYAALFNSLSNLKTSALINLKFSKAEAIQIIDIINFISKLAEANKLSLLLKEIWFERNNYLDYLAVAVACKKLKINQAQNFIKQYNNLARPKCPITGHDILKLGISGKNLGLDLTRLKLLWIESNFTLTKNQLLKMLEN